MRLALVILATLPLVTSAVADERKPSAKGNGRCVDVEVAGRHSYNCLNEALRATTARVSPPQIAAPLDARSADVKLGIVNLPAVQQQYGRNYGVSVMPYRPARP